MTSALYSNIPINNSGHQIISYDTLYSPPLEVETGVLTSIKGFFTSKGFDDISSETIAITLIKQAKLDNYNPMQLLDTLKGLSSVEISALVGEIINFNRFKTSFLGYARQFTPNSEVKRNVIP